MQFLKVLVAAGEHRAYTVEDRARKTLDKISKLVVLVGGPNETLVREHARVAELSGAELIRSWLVITAALSESDESVSEGTCDVRDSFPVEWPSDAPGSSVVCSSEQA